MKLFGIEIKRVKGKPEETSAKVTFEPEIPKARKELFYEAVEEVVKQNIRKDVARQLVEYCYDEETVKQTEKAEEERRIGSPIDVLRRKYPKAIQHYGVFRLTIEPSALIDKISREAVDKLQAVKEDG